MPLLAALITSLFVAIAEFFAKFITRKVAAVAAGFTIMATITTALYVGLGVLVTSIAWAFPTHPALATGIWIMIPDNAAACIAAAIAADVSIAVYRLNVLNVQFAVYAP